MIQKGNVRVSEPESHGTSIERIASVSVTCKRNIVSENGETVTPTPTAIKDLSAKIVSVMSSLAYAITKYKGTIYSITIYYTQ